MDSVISKGNLPELSEIEGSDFLKRGRGGLYLLGIMGGIALLCFLLLGICEFRREANLYRTENREGEVNQSAEVCIHQRDTLTGCRMTQESIRKDGRDTVNSSECIDSAKGFQTDSTGTDHYSHVYSMKKCGISIVALQWRNILLIFLLGVFSFGLIYLFYRAYLSYHASREKMTDLWRRCFMEGYNYKLEGLRKADREEDEEKKKAWKEKDEQESHRKIMEFCRLLCYMKEGEKMTPEKLKSYLEQLEKEYQDIKKLIDKPL